MNSYNKNQLDALISQIYFWNETLHVSEQACKLSANLYATYYCYVYSEKLLMMDRGIVRNM